MRKLFIHKLKALIVMCAAFLLTLTAGFFVGNLGKTEVSAEDSKTSVTFTGYKTCNDNVLLLNTNVAVTTTKDTKITAYWNDVETTFYCGIAVTDSTEMYLAVSKAGLRNNDTSYWHLRIPAGTVFDDYILTEEYNVYCLYQVNSKGWGIIGQDSTTPFAITGLNAVAFDQAGLARWYIALGTSFADGVTVNRDALWNCGIFYATAANDETFTYTLYGGDGSSAWVNYESNSTLALIINYSLVGESSGKNGNARLFKIPKGTIWGGLIGQYRVTNDFWLYFDGTNFTGFTEEPKFINAGAAEVAENQKTATGFTITLSENAVPFDTGWSYKSMQFCGKQLTRNGAATSVFLKKYTATQYYVCLGDVSITAAANDYITINGYFVYSNYFYKISDTTFAYVGGAWQKVAPAIAIAVDGTAVTGNTIAVEIGTAVSSLSITASDFFDSNITAEYTIPAAAVSDSKFVGGTYDFTVKATDSKGYSTTKTVTLKVADTVKPVITVTSVTTTYNEGDTLSYEVSATDNIDGNVAVSVVAPENMTNADGKLVVGTYIIYFTAKDSANNTATTEGYSITVKDITAPVVTLGGTTTYEAGTAYTENSLLSVTATATDVVDGTITTFKVSLEEGAVVDGKLQAGTWTMTVSATDAAGNTGSNTISITVGDTIAPVITISADQKTEYTEGEKPVINASAVDSYDGNVAVQVIYPDGALDADGKLVYPSSGEYTLTLKATDAAGNEATKSLKIFVTEADKEKPVITITGKTEYTVGDKLALTAVATDNVDASVNVETIVPEGALDENECLQEGEWEITFTATDAAGNKATETKTITVTAAKKEESGSNGGCGGLVGLGCASVLFIACVAFFVIKKAEED